MGRLDFELDRHLLVEVIFDFIGLDDRNFIFMLDDRNFIFINPSWHKRTIANITVCNTSFSFDGMNNLSEDVTELTGDFGNISGDSTLVANAG